ncbi:hypothetical protein [Streptomyces platensis]|uniref:hypothetical protein n=1 Tax=Streptomyces platensis TaxID=58346 RepID=UPI00379FD700
MGMVIVAVAIGTFRDQIVQRLTAESSARTTQSADDKADREGPAFASNIRRDTNSVDHLQPIIFNTPFSLKEKNELLSLQLHTGEDPITSFAKSHRGYGVNELGVNYPGKEVYGYSEAWLVDILSDRKASLVINGMHIKGLHCAPAKANTVITYQGQGGGSYEGMFFDLTRSTSNPLIAGDEESHFGKPYFRYKKIDLGNGAAPGGLRIEVASGTKDCNWTAFEVTYADSEGKHTQEITNNGKDFAVHGFTAKPAQVFRVFTTAPFVKECTLTSQGHYKCQRKGW